MINIDITGFFEWNKLAVLNTIGLPGKSYMKVIVDSFEKAVHYDKAALFVIKMKKYGK